MEIWVINKEISFFLVVEDMSVGRQIGKLDGKCDR